MPHTICSPDPNIKNTKHPICDINAAKLNTIAQLFVTSRIYPDI